MNMTTTMMLALTMTMTMTMAQAARAAETETRLAKAEVPAAVIATVARKYPAAEMKGFEKASEDGAVSYEIQIENGSDKIDVELTPAGKITAEEKTIEASALPAAVKSGLLGSKYGRWKIQGAEQVIKDEKADKPLYELVVTRGKSKSEVVFDGAGKITREEVKAP
jgi:hypothetical protein